MNYFLEKCFFYLITLKGAPNKKHWLVLKKDKNDYDQNWIKKNLDELSVIFKYKPCVTVLDLMKCDTILKLFSLVIFD